MTKKTAQENPPEVVEAVPASEVVPNERWLRDSALSYALTLHKNNGGMTTAQQTIGNAEAFLTYLKGE